MSQWSHPMCQQCWEEREGIRVPVRVIERETENCCWCGNVTRSGIYKREDPAVLPEHRDHDRDEDTVVTIERRTDA
jgi:hypothetical protein